MTIQLADVQAAPVARRAKVHRLSGSAAVVRVETNVEPAIAVLSGTFDLSCAFALNDLLWHYVDTCRSGLLLDLSHVESCDFSTVHALLAASERARGRGRSFVIGPHTRKFAQKLAEVGAEQLLTVAR
jgi:anti-anti-sigma regulatory factor